MKNAKKRLIASLMICIFACMGVVGTAFGWWLYNIPNSSNVVIRTGDASKLDVALHIGKDFNRDGELDVWMENNLPVDITERTHTEVLSNMYDPMKKAAGTGGIFSNVTKDMYPGRSIVYKCVIRNDHADSLPTLISTYFSEFNNNLPLLFKLTNLHARAYAAEAYDNEATGYFSTDNLDTEWYQVELEKTDYYFWDMLRMQEFLLDTMLKSDYVLEMDFHILVLGAVEMKDYYDNYALQTCKQMLDTLYELGEEALAEEIRLKLNEIITMLYDITEREIDGESVSRYDVEELIYECADILMDAYYEMEEGEAQDLVEALQMLFDELYMDVDSEINQLKSIVVAYNEISNLLLINQNIRFQINNFYVRGKFLTDQN